MSEKKTPLQRIKSGAFSRGLALAKVSMAAGAKAATHLAGNLIASQDEKADRLKALLGSQVELLVRELGELKGSVMKVGQLLSMYGEQLLPPEVNAVLKSLQSQSPPLDWSAIEPALKRELGAKLAELDIERDLIGSASLGQVHRATIRATGEKIALKVQYPGVDAAIDSDLKALRRIFAVTKLLPKSGSSHDELFEEVRQMLHQEVDYLQEREATDRFREALAADPRFVVPRTFPEFSTARVLATEFIEGIPVDSPEVKALSQERRNALGLSILELYFREFFELNAVQTDPHFGNYRVVLGPPDKLVLLDFGAVRRFGKEFRAAYIEMVRGAFARDSRRVFEGAKGLHFLRDEDTEESRQLFAELLFLLLEAFEDDAKPYDWGASDLPKRAAKRGGQIALQLKLRAPPREVVFLDRKLGGVFIFLSSLQTKFASHSILKRTLERAVI